MTPENSRADALTITEDARDGNWYEFAVNGHHGLIRVVARMEDDDLDYPLGKKVRDFLLAASPVEQPAAAPIDEPLRVLMGAVNAYEKETGIGGWYAERIQESCNALLKAIGSPMRFGISGENPIEELAPSPADERAAFSIDDLDFEPSARHAIADMANIGYALLEQIDRMAPGYHWNESPVEIVSDLINERDDARAASTNETGAEVVTHLKEGRWCPDECPVTGKPFFMWIAHPELGYVPTYGGPFDSYTIAAPDEDGHFRSERYDHDEGTWVEGGAPTRVRRELVVAADLDAAPAQADARVGLTIALRRAREELSIVEWENDPPSGVVKLFDDIDALLAAHPGQPEPRSSITDDQRDKIERAEACLRNTGRKEDCQAASGLLDVLTEHPVQPEPRAEDSPDDRRDGTRWRTLMKNGEPEVFVERTQRRVIQRTQPVAFSNPNLTGADRFDTPSEMWVKRYVMFAWWAREHEHRKFIEAVDAISAGAIR